MFIGYKANEYYTSDYSTQEKVLIADVNRLRLSPYVEIGTNILFHADIDNQCIVSNYTQSAAFKTM